MSSAPPSPAPNLLRPPSFHPATVEWAPGSQPRYVVINPMHIITLQDRTKTFAVRVVEKIKSFSERWFSHILLLLFLLIYASLGALLFQWLEAPLEKREKIDIVRTRELVIKNLWKAARVDIQNEEEWHKLANHRMKEYEGQVEQHFLSKTAPDSENTVWTFWGALFYAGTIFTTIGYGNIVPATTAGQAVTIIYAFIGIPFLLMVLADLGRLFTRAIKAVFYYFKVFCRTGKIRKARKMGRRATSVPVQYMSVAWNKMPYLIYQNRGKRGSMDVTSAETRDIEASQNEGGTSEKEEEKAVTDDDVEAQKANREEKEPDVDTVANTALDDSIDDEFNLPVSMAIFLLLAYMMLGAFMFTLWESWTFFESFYFVFISMSTIGFGDYVPDHPIFMMGTFIYLLFGLALTSMCINVIQEKLSATFEMAKLRIGTTIGLDANMIMEEDVSEKAESPDKKNESIKSRRGSKVPPGKSPDGDKEEEKSNVKSPDKSMTNGITENSVNKSPDTPVENRQ